MKISAIVKFEKKKVLPTVSANFALKRNIQALLLELGFTFLKTVKLCDIFISLDRMTSCFPAYREDVTQRPISVNQS